jgi:hypothetical protein
MGIVKKILLSATLFIALQACNQEKVDFSTQVKPILNKRCISCHGGVKKNGGFSVLFREEALDTTESGKHAIIPGNASGSEMIRRLTLKDPEQRMPYKEEALTAAEIRTLSDWIDQGAEWGDHWAYVPPKPTKVPEATVLSSFNISDQDLSPNEIDLFILDKLKQQNLQPSPEADRATLVRRAYMDIVGLPPTYAQAEQFINDQSPLAYEKMVDSLLGSPHFGEKWASWWLDLARYSDTKGYERDVTRTIWRYRDWVIQSFNADKPFDQFTIEQLAGDLLPNPSDDQLVATAFHRNTMNNDEGGTEDEEFRIAALIDRVNTTWEVWQSTTMGCVQCHTHPYDPFRHEDYYKTMAYFNNTRDEDTEGEHPNLRMYAPEDQKKLERIKKWVRTHDEKRVTEVARFLKTLEPKYHPHDFDEFVNAELIDTKWLGVRPGGSARIKNINLQNKTQLIIHYWKDQREGSFEIRKDKIDGEVIARVFPQKTGPTRKAMTIALKPTAGVHDLYFVFPDNPALKKGNPVSPIEWLAFREDLPGKNTHQFSSIEKSFAELLNADVQNTPIMIENGAEQKRETKIFERGNWLVKGKAVQPEIPAFLNPQKNDFGADRLGFAKWLVSKENPLTARTLSNRIWEQLFGRGLVETLEDFGTQGAQPSHQELLDWLALRLINEHHWSMKKLIKDIVMSSTYRQSSRTTPEMLEKDPSNMFLARAPRIRLSAEQVRDHALAVSGLLSKKMFGKSVMPYQPEGIWQSVWNGETWKESEGEDQYRRAVYTFIKRTSPYPSMMMFDGSSREVCVSRRIRTNTPLQALVTLNDPAFVQAARNFAKTMASETGSADERISAGYKRITFRSLPDTKLKALRGLYHEAFSTYSKDRDKAIKLTTDKNATAELAALTVVANAMLNLDEVITRD